VPSVSAKEITGTDSNKAITQALKNVITWRQSVTPRASNCPSGDVDISARRSLSEKNISGIVDTSDIYKKPFLACLFRASRLTDDKTRSWMPPGGDTSFSCSNNLSTWLFMALNNQHATDDCFVSIILINKAEVLFWPG